MACADALIPFVSECQAAIRHGLGNQHVHFARVDSGHVMRHPETVEALRSLILPTSDERVPHSTLA